MKTIFKILFFIVFYSLSFSQSYDWITPNKNYLKLCVIDDGMYRITQGDFTQAGINTASIDPRTIKLYYLGQEIPIYFQGDQDGVFNPNDYLDFFGTRNYGGLTNTYLASYGPTALHYITNEYYNQYSDTNVYWLGWDGAAGPRYSASAITVTEPYLNNYFLEKIHFEKDSLYSPGETININSDFRYFNNEKISGEGWFWRNLTAQFGMSHTSNFTIPQLSSQPVNCGLRIFAYPNSKDTSFNEHKLILKINNTTITTLARNDYSRFDTTVTFSSSLLQQNNSVNVTYTPTFGNPAATPSLYFDLVELNYPGRFRFENNICRFDLPSGDTSYALFKVTGFNPSNPLSIYDTRHSAKIVNIEANGDTLLFTGRKDGRFEVINAAVTRRPFRITVRQVQNLAAQSNQSNYLVIYNRLFESQASQLINHRASFDHFTAFKAPVDDIIDIFNYGIEGPAAIRNFVKYVYENWQEPKLKYVCLFGRGSLDPKNIRGSSSYYKNLIPVYGNPAADGYFVNFNLNGFVYYKQVSVGRLTAYTPQEAQDIVNKIIDYDNTPPESWWKKFIMITGGPNRNEQLIYQGQSNEFINNYILPPPISGIPSRIYRNDSAGYITFNYADSIRKEINRGGLLVNFIGHAASQDWELGLEDPGTLSNGSRLPFVLSMTCFTGKNAEPNLRGFGEKFLYSSNRGAIGFLGSTGWSFSTTGNILNKFILSGLANDSLRRLGDLVKFAGEEMLPDSSSFQTRNMINCYDLQGDPATMLRLPIYPEFVITAGDYRLSNPYPIVGEPVRLTIYPKNYGTHAPTCPVRFQILRNGQQYRTKDTLINNFKFTDTLNYNFTLDTLGNYSLMVELDYDNAYPEEDPNNNVLIIPLPLRNISYSPLKPVHNSVIRSDSVEFTGLNPQVDPRSNNIKIILQVDTNKNFNSVVYNYSTQNITGPVSKVRYRIPWLDSNIVYYWRTNSIINGDSTGWSGTNAFVYNPGVTQSKTSRGIGQDSVITIYQKLQGQFNPQDVSNLQYTPQGFRLFTFPGTLHVKSYGSNGFQASFFNINNYTIYADGGNNQGLNIVKVRRFTGNLVEFRNFAFSSPQSSDSVLNFLNTFDTSYYVMIGYAAVHPLANDSLHASARARIRQFGSVYVDSLPGMRGFDSWAFIGYQGGAPPNVSEEFHRYPAPGCPDNWCPSNAQLSPTFLSTYGTINFSMGPAHRWKYFTWDQQLPPFSQIKFDVIGINRDEDSLVLYPNLATNSYVSLDSVNSYNLPNLRLFAKVSIDTINGLSTPYFKNLYFKYTPPCEIIPDNYSFVKSDSVVQEGEEVSVSINVHNTGFVPAGIAVYKWTAVSGTGLHTLKTDTVYTPLAVDSIKNASVIFNTQGLKNPQSTSDTVNISLEVSLPGNQNDYYEYNNFAFTKLVIYGDSTGPSIQVTFDGEKLINGDYIRSKPEIVFKFFDDSPISYTMEDTGRIFIKVDDLKIYYNGNPNIIFEPVNDGNLKTKVTYTPELDEGEHIFRFIGGDRDGNRDTVENTGNVSNAFQVRNVYNFPNPFSSFTNFTFILQASDNVQSCKIKIYTVAGRLVKEINTFAKVGFNMVYWDGRDTDGDTMANGVYLYKIILDDGTKNTTQIQKLAILK